MKESLDRFGENYKYPLYVSVIDKTGFLSTHRANPAFTAVTDSGKLLLVEYHLYGITGNKTEYELSYLNLKSLKIRKIPFLNQYSIKTVFRTDKKKIRLNITAFAMNIARGNFPEQAENAVNFLETLKNWQNYIKE